MTNADAIRLRTARLDDIPALIEVQRRARPEWMRHGLGGALAADVVTRARTAGARRIQVVANPGAIPFYDRHGFSRSGATETRFGPAPRFTLELGGRDDGGSSDARE